MAQTIIGGATREGSLETLTEMLAGLIGTAATLHLFKVGFSPGPTKTQADFAAQESGFHGYTAGTITWGTPGLDNEGDWVAMSDLQHFENDDGTLGETVGGFWVEINLGGSPAVKIVHSYGSFNPSMAMTGAGQFIDVAVALSAPNTEGYAVAFNGI